MRKFHSIPIICIYSQVLPTQAQKYILNNEWLQAHRISPVNMSLGTKIGYKKMKNYFIAYMYSLFICYRKVLSNY